MRRGEPRVFRAHRGSVRVGLEAQTRDVVADLLLQVDELLDDGRASTSADPLVALVGMDLAVDGLDVATAGPEDAAVARLLPLANREDPELAQEFRRLTEQGLRARKRTGLQVAAAALRRPEPVTLSAEEAQTLLKALTDLRLVLGERLGIRTDEDAAALHELSLHVFGEQEQVPGLSLVMLYDFVTELQELLVHEVAKLPRSR